MAWTAKGSLSVSGHQRLPMGLVNASSLTYNGTNAVEWSSTAWPGLSRSLALRFWLIRARGNVLRIGGGQGNLGAEVAR